MENRKLTKTITIVDPPSGWKYGFPKALPENCLDIGKFLADSGYPRSDIDFAKKNCRMWTEEVEIEKKL